jgi:hypothetical protein
MESCFHHHPPEILHLVLETLVEIQGVRSSLWVVAEVAAVLQTLLLRKMVGREEVLMWELSPAEQMFLLQEGLVEIPPPLLPQLVV